MNVLLLIFGSVLLPKVYSLQCYECLIGAACSNSQRDCPTGLCGTTRVISYVGGSKQVDLNIKSCAVAEQCISGSINFGVAKTVLATKCCSTDLCNNQEPQVSSDTSPNGKKCYGCNTENCNAVMECSGTEDRCISALAPGPGGGKQRVKGCVSKSVCSALSVKEVAANIGQDVSCCEGNMCNSAGTTAASLLLLAAPMLSFALFF
ncbi:urokinase plasminogen activator surface receptor [Myripristis murdjan]|uniref:UPAR/Ly6 domain-containing protein n=1 Tax=Myripristis murdjan TaxID=586833 RepID=A0A667ZGB3_9TELE|nr:urokinase plasminogen activator surface receptor [Myripristis murdjan]